MDEITHQWILLLSELSAHISIEMFLYYIVGKRSLGNSDSWVQAVLSWTKWCNKGCVDKDYGGAIAPNIAQTTFKLSAGGEGLFLFI